MKPRRLFDAIAIGLLAVSACDAQGGVVFGNNGLNGGARWDAAPRVISGFERSLNGGLRYSVQGGSWQAYRDAFTWATVPTLAEFQQAVEQAFDAWTAVDPVTNLGTDLYFVEDFGTPVNSTLSGFVRWGAEIDLFATNLGDSRTRGFANFNWVNGRVKLTSGTTNYNAPPISGADVTINANPGAVYTLDFFRRLLTHELGHALGFGDVEGDINPNNFIDDNYDGTSSITAHETLNNSWALLVNTANPSNSPLSIYHVPDSDPGVDSFGVNILMESRGLGIGSGNPVSNLTPLSNDDYGIRQFLYPGQIVLPPIGDMNGDGQLTNADIAAFVLALTDLPGFEQQYPDVDANDAGDFTGDGLLTNGDIAGFVDALTGGTSVVPEPGSFALLGLAVLGCCRRRRCV